jgi:two-component system cell cycle sensor histidine kinase/response regulator CckA
MPNQNPSLDPSRGRASVRPASGGEPIVPLASDPSGQFRLLFDLNPAPMCVFDLETLRLLEVNEALCALYGYSRAELLTMKSTDALTEEGMAVLTSLTPPPAGVYLWSHRTKAGVPLTAEVSGRDLEFGGRKARLVVVTDVTGRVATEAALRVQRERLSLALETAGMTAFEWDVVRGEMLYQRPGKPDLRVSTAGGWEGQGSFLDAVPEDRQMVEERLAAALAGDGDYHVEFRNRDRTGAIRWAAVDGRVTRDAEGRPVRLVGVAADITERQERSEAIARLACVVESSDDAVISTDLDFVIVSWNPGAERMFGFTAAEAIGQTTEDVFPPRPGDGTDQRKDLLRTGAGIPDVERVWPTKDGGSVTALSSFFPLNAADGTTVGYASVARDITERKHSDNLVRESEARFRAFVEAAPSAIWIYDGADTLFVNNALVEMTGYSREQLTKPGEFEKLFDPQDNRAMGRRAQARLRGEKVVPNYEVRITRADGEKRWLAVSAATITLDGRPAVLVNAFDATDSKRAEILLRQSEQRFRRLVDNSPDFITRIDRNLQHVFVNATAEREAGLHPKRILGKRADQIGYPAQIGALWVARHQQVLDSGEAVEFEYELEQGGEIRFRRCRLIPEFGDSGAVEHVLSVVTDLTTEKRAEEERRRLDLQVQNAQKLESLGVLAGGIAHDFNNLLVAMLGNAGLALVELPPESPARQTVQAIEVAAQRAADLTRQMLAYSGKGRFVIEMLNLSRVVEEMSHLLEVSISRRARIEYHFAPELPQVEADATQIRQVIMNLITNASDAVTERGGVVSLSTGVIHANAGYLAGTYIDSDLAEGDYVFVEVADTGEGMDEETRQRIFDPFFTTKFTGRGLGLAAVLGIVRGHKGAIKLESQPGHGTTFTVLLPAAPQPADVTDGAPELMTERPGSHSATVLIADDDETVRNVTRRILEHSGYSVLMAADGREAVELYREHEGAVDIVLLDMTMPHMDGEETFRELRQIDPTVRVLLTSGYNEQDATERFAGKGLIGFIQKPYRPNELVDRIEAALAE